MVNQSSRLEGDVILHQADEEAGQPGISLRGREHMARSERKRRERWLWKHVALASYIQKDEAGRAAPGVAGVFFPVKLLQVVKGCVF